MDWKTPKKLFRELKSDKLLNLLLFVSWLSLQERHQVYTLPSASVFQFTNLMGTKTHEVLRLAWHNSWNVWFPADTWLPFQPHFNESRWVNAWWRVCETKYHLLIITVRNTEHIGWQLPTPRQTSPVPLTNCWNENQMTKWTSACAA